MNVGVGRVSAGRGDDGDRWAADRGLVARTVLALLFVLALPVAFVHVLVWGLGTALPPALSAVAGVTVRLPTRPPLPVVLVCVALGFLAQYALAPRLALRSLGARQVDAESHPELHAAVTRLAIQGNVPVPRVAVATSRVPNAFAVGRRAGDATVVVTTALLDTLDARERDAVLAHELAHVRNRDAAVMTLANFLPTLTVLVVMVVYYLLAGLLSTVGSVDVRHVDKRSVHWFVVVAVVLVVAAVVTVSVAAVFWVGSLVLFRLLSQYREFAADRAAAALTGDPAALASALGRLDAGAARAPDRDLRDIDGGLEALFLVPVDSSRFEGYRDLISRDVFPATHPPTAERIARLEALAASLER
ncbi:M48 family metalloprotease [Haloglomus litoreum]|uniref:M48 family metalloprotease n=1 Tax=Haloglomus litoreum TaxID=3034026 RepID=UPI0023E77679|nr:M48 family metalloprotease [Haloglomus sp. DT116]